MKPKDPTETLKGQIASLTPAQRALFEQRLRAKSARSLGEQEIPRAHDRGEAPLSFAQQRLWFLDQLAPGNPFYNLPRAYRARGVLRPDILRRALCSIVSRHEALRTTFAIVDGQPVQRIAADQPVELSVVDVSGFPRAERERRFEEWLAAEARRPFDLTQGPLLRAGLLRLAEQEHVLLLTMHHIVCDGWSLSILTQELARFYDELSGGRPEPLPELPIQYADFARWQREWLSGEVLEEQLSYWKQQLASLPVLELPTDRPRPPVQSFRGARESISFSSDLVARLKELSQREGATLYMTLLAAFQALLARYTGQEDIVVGSPIAGRNRAEIEGLIGFFVNTLVLRTGLSEDPSFRELLGRVREAALQAYAHQDLPFEKLVEELQPERDLGQNPLFSVIFAVQNAPTVKLQLPGLVLTGLGVESRTTRFDLEVYLWESEGRIEGSFVYATDLFDASTIERLSRHFQFLLEGIVAAPDRRVSEIPLMSESERRQVLEEWNQTAREYPHEATIHGLFEEQVERAPQAEAVVFDGERLSYGQLNERANQLARHLRKLGVGPEVLVGLCVERSLEMVVGLLGILKAGGAYVPLDPAYPRQRLAFMLEDTATSLVLTQQSLCEILPEGLSQRVCLDTDWQEIEKESGENPRSQTTPDNLAYVLYTSGSTGKPKGVAMPHRALVNLVAWQMGAGQNSAAKTLQFASLSFDVSFQEMFSTWCAGGTLVLVPDEVRRDAAALWRLLSSESVERLFLPFVALQHLAETAERDGWEAPTLREVIAAGEQLQITKQIVRLFGERPSRSLQNQYGPSESHVATAFTLTGPAQDWPRLPPIGRPIANARIYVLDRHSQPVPVGVTGELHIGGVLVARGYWSRPELTSERFLPDPFDAHAGARLYKTGDLARYRADGVIEFLGRADQQVKIRGYRIELGEIEEALARHSEVRACAVAVRDKDSGGKHLVGYIVARDGVRPSVTQLRDFLKTTLPDYMVPSAFVFLDDLPMTPSGKVDRKALPAPEETRPELEDIFVAPRTPIEEVLAAIWMQVLRIERIGVEDDFFELGGHSLLATQVVSRIRKAFRVELPLRALFEGRTVAGLARRIASVQQERTGVAAVPLVPVARDDDLVLSFAQQRLWFLDQLEPGKALYALSRALRLEGDLDVDALEKAFRAIVERHEALRTRFQSVDGRPVQIIEPDLQFRLSVVDLSGLPVQEREAEASRRATEQTVRPFDLTSGLLLRAGLLRLSEREHVLLLAMHHIVSDGWSMGIFIQELARFYEEFSGGRAAALVPLPVQYADFAHWQREWLSGEVLEKQLSYWKKQLAELAVLELPTDRPRPPVQSFRGARHSISFSKDLLKGLKELSQREGTTLYMTLLAAFQTLLMRYTGQEDVVVGSPIAGRNRAEIEGLIGFFVNTLVLRTDLSGNPSFRELVGRVREVALEAYAHQDLPFEKLVEELQPERTLGQNPLFQVLFAHQNAPRGSFELAGLEAAPLPLETRSTRFDLEVYLWEKEDGLTCSFIYATDLFDAETIERMIGHYQRALEDIVANPDRRIDELSLLSEAELHRVLDEWNETTADYPRGATVHGLFETQAERTPDAVAVVAGRERLTYRQLNERANRLARYLRKRGVGPEVLVGVFVERSLEMIVGLLGILKAGGGYVPLDPGYPQPRVAFMLEDSGARLVLTQESLSGLLPKGGFERVRLDADWPEIARESAEDPAGAATAENRAYVIYTSGSTGTPKGVEIEHHSTVALLAWAGQAFNEGELDGVLASTSVCFDLSVFELFAPLVWGGKVILSPDALQLPELPAFAEVKLVNTVPSAIAELLRIGGLPESVNTINLAGEPLTASLVNEILRRGAGRQVFDLYGPTEDTTYSTCARRSLDGPATIGRPISNKRVYILDPHLQPVPIGVVGDLYLAGAGVARGYLNRPEMTAEKFLDDPFRGAGERMYRTGDRGRFLSDGQIQFLGRLDHQVKIRGYRIEMGEIEEALARHPEVRASVVVVRQEESGDKRLVGYVVPRDGASPSVTQLRGFLKSTLPDYMVPSAFLLLDALPLTPNGKVDRQALPAPEHTRPELEDAFVAPRDPIEQTVAGIWSQVLGLEKVGVHDNFFELGGHSLLATLVFARLQKAFPVAIPLRTLFEKPTVAELSAAIEELQGGDTGPRPAPILPVSRQAILREAASAAGGGEPSLPKRSGS